MARSEGASTKQASVCQNPLPVPIHSFRTDIVQRNKLELQRSFQHDFILLLQAPEKQIMAMKLNLFPYVLWRGGQCGPTAILSNCAVSFNAKPEFSLTLSLGVWHTDQNFIRSFWEWCDGTHKTWPTILVAFIGMFLVYNPALSLFRHQFSQLHSRMARLVLISLSLLACGLSNPSPQKKHPLKLGHDLRGHKHQYWLPEWQKKQLIYRGKPPQLKDLRVC